MEILDLSAGSLGTGLYHHDSADGPVDSAYGLVPVPVDLDMSLKIKQDHLEAAQLVTNLPISD